MKRISMVFFLLTMAGDIFSQQPHAQFVLPSSACLNQNISLINQSLNATRYEWDFLQGDLSLSPQASSLGSAGGNVTTGIDIVFDGVNWYGFVASRNSNSIIRLDYGTDINTIPDVVPLDNIFSGTVSPTDIKIVFEEDEWFAFVYGRDQLIVRIDFGASLSSIPAPSTTYVIMNEPGSADGGLDMIYDNGWYITYTKDSEVGVVRLNTIRDIPAAQDKIATTIGGGSLILGDIKLLKDQTNWFGYTVSYFGSKQIQRVSFGTDLLASPSAADISGSVLGTLTPYGVDGGIDKGNFFIFISTVEGNLIKVDLGSDLSQLPANSVALGTLNTLSNTLKIRLIKSGTNWSAFSVSWANGQLFRIDFPNPSTSAASLFTSAEPKPTINFNNVGSSYVTLRSFNGGAFDEKHRTISINNQEAPDIDFAFQNICLNSPVNFSSMNVSNNIDTYNWDFGDGTTILGDNSMAHTYTATGNFNIALTVTASTGCNNFVERSIKIYPPPAADFTLPTASPICTIEEYLFLNNTADPYEGNLSHQWFVDDEPVSIDRDLQFSFETTGVKTIKLQTSIPGCMDEVIQITSNIQAGPIVDFSFLGKCFNEETQFTTNISEPVTSQTWDFNDGSTSTETDPINIFSNPGEYSVSLQATSTNGCNNSVTKPVTIYSLPIVDFSIPAPPLSCTGSSTQFANLTANPPDGTITTWLWNFDDAAATENTSSLQDPSHTFANAGSYDVTLTATTEEGCSGTLQKAITIEQSPSATVESSVACKSLPVNFTATGTDLQSYYWEMGTSYYTEANPTHTFSVPGDYQILLTVQGNNNCETTYERFISVPVPLEPDFSVLKNCVDHQTEFTDITLGADPVAQQEWDFDGLATATGSSVVYSFNSLGSKSITLKVTAESGCSYSINRTIEIAQAPTANFDASPEVGAMPLVVRFTNTSTDATQHEWTFGDAAQGTSNEVSPSCTFQDTGEFMTELKASNNEGCESTATKLITVVAPLPDVDIRRINVSENPDGSMQVIITLENKGNTFLENLPVDVDISGKVALREVIEESIAPAAMYNLVLSYSLTQLSGLSFLCASTTLANDLVPEGNQICIELDDKVFLFSPYPNPVKNDLELTWIAPAEETVTFTLVDAFGKTVLSSSLSSTPGLNRTVYDVSHLGSGIYILTLKAGSASKTQRIVISREN